VSPRFLRLDAEMVRRGLARSREQAAELIRSGCVAVNGSVAVKAATRVATDAPIVVRESSDDPGYVSRGARKLAGALTAFTPLGLRIAGRRCLDAGASTGGFTDVLLRAGAAEVVAVDVGYGQLAWSIRQDSRVTTLDRTNVRDISRDSIGGAVDLVVGDLSFISLLLVLNSLTAVTLPDGDLVLMVKPQFEVGKHRVGKGGVVRDTGLRTEAVTEVATAAAKLGWGAQAVLSSPLPGPSGNVEFFVWLRNHEPCIGEGEIAVEVERSRDWGASRASGASWEPGESGGRVGP
jgi:23S rRNA (cytidine1920-2'-O)/16S rRNA (cytidine1409-2'-O)-methyltransferase